MHATAGRSSHAHVICRASVKEVAVLDSDFWLMCKLLNVFSLVVGFHQAFAFVSHQTGIWPSSAHDFGVNSDAFKVNLQSANCASVHFHSCASCCLDGCFQLLSLACVLGLVVPGAPRTAVAVNAVKDFKVLS